MRLFSTGLCTTVAVALLAGCSGNMSQTPSTFGSGVSPQTMIKNGREHRQKPVWRSPANLVNNDAVRPWFHTTLAKLTAVRRPSGSLSKGIYVNQFYGNAVYAYQNKNTGNNPPACTVPTGSSSYVNGISVDQAGNLITPLGSNYSGQHAVEVWQGPGMCGASVGSFLEPFGQPASAVAFDAIHSTIWIGNIFDNSGAPGSISICSLSSGGCTTNLTNAAMYKVAGIAVDPSSGDCWASAEDYSGVASLTYFAGCTGGGVQATGFMNTDYGSLQFDKNGNLVSMDKTGLQLWVYHGCNPTCTLVGGPFPLTNECVWGNLNKQSMTLACGATLAGQVDIYYYSPTGLTYWYSFNNGLSVSGTVEGISYNPTSPS
jgi:hypothetical protein